MEPSGKAEQSKGIMGVAMGAGLEGVGAALIRLVREASDEVTSLKRGRECFRITITHELKPRPQVASRFITLMVEGKASGLPVL